MIKKYLFFWVCFFFFFSFQAQTLNQNANWPNSNWVISGTYNSSVNAFESNPTVDANFAFDDDDAGNGNSDDIAAESPIINLTSAFNAGETILMISTDYFFRVVNTIGTSQDDLLIIQYWDADNSVWVDWSGPISGTEGPGGSNTNNFCTPSKITYESSELDISNFTSNQLSGFKYRIFYDDDGQNSSGDNWEYGFCFDSPVISSEAPPCEDPSTIIIDNVTDSSADISWTENGTASEWEILYGEAGFDPNSAGSSVMDTDGTIGEIISPLMANADYDVYVRAMCSSNNPSDWVGPETFTTEQLPCEMPTAVTIDNITENTADVTWTENGTASEWEILYGEAGFDPNSAGSSVMDTDGTIGETLSGLDPDTAYDVYVRAMCSDDNMSEWSDVQTFTTEDLGVNDIAFQSLSLYPNPVKSNLTISAKSNVEQLELFSLLGQKVKTLSPNSTQTRLDLSGLSSGTYLLKVTINDSSKTFRIIKE